jgi:hypothetical protein
MVDDAALIDPTLLGNLGRFFCAMYLSAGCHNRFACTLLANPATHFSPAVMLAQAAIRISPANAWIPAFAGMTKACVDPFSFA